MGKNADVTKLISFEANAIFSVPSETPVTSGQISCEITESPDAPDEMTDDLTDIPVATTAISVAGTHNPCGNNGITDEATGITDEATGIADEASGITDEASGI